MICDDADIFEPIARDQGPDGFAAAMAAADANEQHGPVDQVSMRLLSEMASKSWPLEGAESGEDTLSLLDKAGHRRRAGILTRHQGAVALWATEGYSVPIGPIARSGPMLSPAFRDRLLYSIDHAAPEAKLEELRALARQREHTGISAWRMVRAKELGTELRFQHEQSKPESSHGPMVDHHGGV